MNYKECLNLKDKTVVITGASSGIGRECAIAASQLGASVALVARNEERLSQTLSQMETGDHKIYPIDITDFDKLESLITNIVNDCGKISGFIHSAGIEGTIPLRDMGISDYTRFFSVNVFSGLELSRIISKKKNFNKSGCSMIFLSSVMGICGQSGKIAYCATKGSLISASKAMSIELSPKGIRVNSVLPGMVKTEMMNNFFYSMPESSRENVLNMHPLGLGEPQDVAALCMFLLSDASKWITGSSYVIDGGYTAV